MYLQNCVLSLHMSYVLFMYMCKLSLFIAIRTELRNLAVRYNRGEQNETSVFYTPTLTHKVPVTIAVDSIQLFNFFFFFYMRR